MEYKLRECTWEILFGYRADNNFSNIDFLADSLRRVKILKLEELHLPHLQTSSLISKSGWFAIAASIPALNEWPVIRSDFGPR
jgi:hypothetical protein